MQNEINDNNQFSAIENSDILVQMQNISDLVKSANENIDDKNCVKNCLEKISAASQKVIELLNQSSEIVKKELEENFETVKSFIKTTKNENINFNGQRILLVEDNELSAEITAEVLEMANLKVEFAQNGQIAVDKVLSSPENYYDIILMDIQMPVMNGYEATKKIRAAQSNWTKDVPIIAMTANNYAKDIDETIASGMNGHVTKPIKFENFVDTLKIFMNNKWQSAISGE